MILQVPVSSVFTRIRNANTRIVVNEGSSRSTKTYSIIQYLISECLDHYSKNLEPLTITVARLKFAWMKQTLLRDFEEILRTQFNMWDENCYNKTDHTYELKGSRWYFVGLDEPQKLHGLKQDIMWINEAIEATKPAYDQLSMRTKKKIILDYNPSTDTHWIYDTVIPRNDCTFIKSTYKDNPFLEPAVRAEIERLEPTPENIAQGTADEVSWKIYGLGERASQRGLIFGSATIVEAFPPENECKKIFRGLDFGYTNDPTALMRVGLCRGELFIEEELYKRGLVNRKNLACPNQPSIEAEFERIGIKKTDTIWADAADPKSIQDLRNCGYDVRPAIKGQDSVVNGIDLLKRYKINIVKTSVNLIKERNNYKWKIDAAGNALNVPVDAFNHGWDAVRYGAIMELGPRATPNIR